MKISLVARPTQQQTDNDDCIQVHISQLNDIENASCTEIQLLNTLEKVETPQEVLQQVIMKLRYGGTLIIVSTNILAVARDIINNTIQFEEWQPLLYQKTFLPTLAYLKQLLKSYNLNILNTYYGNTQYAITAIRPNVT